MIRYIMTCSRDIAERKKVVLSTPITESQSRLHRVIVSANPDYLRIPAPSMTGFRPLNWAQELAKVFDERLRSSELSKIYLNMLIRIKNSGFLLPLASRFQQQADCVSCLSNYNVSLGSQFYFSSLREVMLSLSSCFCYRHPAVRPFELITSAALQRTVICPESTESSDVVYLISQRLNRIFDLRSSCLSCSLIIVVSFLRRRLSNRDLTIWYRSSQPHPVARLERQYIKRELPNSS